MTLDDSQAKLVAWGTECFGAEHMADSKVRALRLLEEAIEFAQAVEAPSDQCIKLVDYVYSRPIGKPKQELGGIGVTWLVAAAALGESADESLRCEMERIAKKPPSHFAQRNQQKLDAGFTAQPVTKGVAPPAMTAERFYISRNGPSAEFFYLKERKRIFTEMQAFGDHCLSAANARIAELESDKSADDRDWKQIALALGVEEETREDIVKAARKLVGRIAELTRALGKMREANKLMIELLEGVKDILVKGALPDQMFALMKSKGLRVVDVQNEAVSLADAALSSPAADKEK